MTDTALHTNNSRLPQFDLVARRVVLFLWAVVALAGPAGSAQQPAPTDRYEQMLYELGAFPVAKLSNPYWTNGNPGKVYGKGERVDVDGWLPPYWAADYLTDAEKAAYGIPKKPLSYERYMAMLDIDEYKRTHDPQLFIVMRFALDELGTERIAVKKSDMLRLYEARIGLEAFARPLLKGRLSSEDAMRLIQTYPDDRLFDDGILPPVIPGDTAYIKFLEGQADAAKRPLRARDNCFKLLLAVDDKSYRGRYQDFLLANVKTAQDWFDRATMYFGLIRLNDEKSMVAVRYGLIHDPITECRELILYELQQRREVAGAIDAILVIANGKDDLHRAVTPSRMSEGWSYNLEQYLEWAATQNKLDEATSKKVIAAAAMIKAWGPARKE